MDERAQDAEDLEILELVAEVLFSDSEDNPEVVAMPKRLATAGSRVLPPEEVVAGTSFATEWRTGREVKVVKGDHEHPQVNTL